MKLVFLKNKSWPRIAPPMDTHLVNPSSSDLLEEHCTSELMAAATNHDPTKFRSALEALVLNLFDTDLPDDAT